MLPLTRNMSKLDTVQGQLCHFIEYIQAQTKLGYTMTTDFMIIRGIKYNIEQILKTNLTETPRQRNTNP